MKKTRPPAEGHIPPGDGERQMFCAAILQAWEDYFTPMPSRSLSPFEKVRNDNTLSELRKAKREAHSFFTHTSGPWCQSRADICGAAGIDPDALRQRFLKKQSEAA